MIHVCGKRQATVCYEVDRPSRTAPDLVAAVDRHWQQVDKAS